MIFVALAIISIGYYNTVHTKTIAENWDHSNNTTTKSDGAKNMQPYTGFMRGF